MTLLEAHASGRRYRRANHTVWRDYHRLGGHDGHSLVLIDHVFATDYELEPEAKLLTREAVWAAIYRAGGNNGQEVCNILFGEEDV